MRENRQYIYNPETKKAMAYVTYNGITFATEATCHENDYDFESERTGLQIADIRANIRILQYKRDTEIKPVIKSLEHLLHNIQSSSQHNPKAYESIMIRNQLKAYKKDLEEINKIINDEKAYLKEYINNKDKLYIKLRAKNNNQ